MRLSVLHTKGAKFSLAVGIFSSCTIGAFAWAVPVIDWDNIAQQIKTYTETVKVVQTQIETVNTLKNELVGRPIGWFNDQKAVVMKNMDDIKKLSNDTKSLLGTTKTSLQDVEKSWGNTFASIKELPDGKKSYQQAELAQQATDANIEKEHKKGIVFLDTLTNKLRQLTKSVSKDLDELPKLKDQKSIQQLQTVIAAKQAQIQSISGQIQTINAKNNIIQQQKEITDKQNKEEANKETSKNMEETAKKLDESIGTDLPKAFDDFKIR